MGVERNSLSTWWSSMVWKWRKLVGDWTSKWNTESDRSWACGRVSNLCQATYLPVKKKGRCGSPKQDLKLSGAIGKCMRLSDGHEMLIFLILPVHTYTFFFSKFVGGPLPPASGCCATLRKGSHQHMTTFLLLLLFLKELLVINVDWDLKLKSLSQIQYS